MLPAVTRRLRHELVLILVFKLLLLYGIKQIWFDAPPAWHQSPDAISAHILPPAADSVITKESPHD